MKKSENTVVILICMAFMLIALGGLYIFQEMMRDHYCFTIPFNEMKRSKICKEYWDGEK